MSHVHHWVIDEQNGTNEVAGRCDCGARRSFLASSDSKDLSASWNDYRMPTRNQSKRVLDDYQARLRMPLDSGLSAAMGYRDL